MYVPTLCSRLFFMCVCALFDVFRVSLVLIISFLCPRVLFVLRVSFQPLELPPPADGPGGSGISGDGAGESPKSSPLGQGPGLEVKHYCAVIVDWLSICVCVFVSVSVCCFSFWFGLGVTHYILL